MARLRGIGLGAGMALGTAAVVKMRNGVPIMPEMPPRIASLVAQRRVTEIPDVVIVAEEYRIAGAIAGSLSWAKVVGIAVEREDTAAAVPSVPAVTGLSGLMQAAADDLLILVDATRGIVLVDPDPIYLAQYTAEHDRIAPKNRLYLDEEHLPALTSDGRAISVMAITNGAGVDAALASGSDALYHALPLTFDPSDLRRHLAELLVVAAGKPLTVPYNPSLPLTPIVEAASHTDITLALAPPDGAFAPRASLVSQVMREIEFAQAECAEKDIVCGVPRIAVEIANRPDTEWPTDDETPALIESLAAAGATRLILYGAADTDSMRSLANFAAIASVNLMPVNFYVDQDGLPGKAGAEVTPPLKSGLCLLIGAGITGFLVSPDLTQSVKAAIRDIVAAECMDQFAGWITRI